MCESPCIAAQQGQAATSSSPSGAPIDEPETLAKRLRLKTLSKGDGCPVFCFRWCIYACRNDRYDRKRSRYIKPTSNGHFRLAAVPSVSGGNQATASPPGPSRVSFEQALQQGVAASPPPRAVSGSQTPAAERSAQPSVEPSGYRPSYGAAAAAGAANVAASSPWPASAAAAVSGCQPAAAAPPPSPPCTPPVVVTEQTPEAGDQTTPGDDVKIRELERTLPSNFPRRPAHGQLGRTIQLLANHFSIEIPTGSVYHYDVDISSETAQETKVPEQNNKKYRQDLANCIPAFDGRKNQYTRRQVNVRERTFTVDLEEDQRSQKIIIKIQYAATVNLEALHGLFEKRRRIKWDTKSFSVSPETYAPVKW
ncbi:uncharacterized protein LOC144114117 [Amblyomma americanum]